MTPADVVTLGRGLLSIPLVRTAVRRDRQAIAFWSAVIAATALDWIDGPLARRLGPTPLGQVLDIEVDSWLTLATALAAVRLGRLPRACLIPPILRYLLAPGPAVDHLSWHRWAGRAQMGVLLVGLSPLAVPGGLAATAAGAQLAALAHVAWMRSRRSSRT